MEQTHTIIYSFENSTKNKLTLYFLLLQSLCKRVSWNVCVTVINNTNIKHAITHLWPTSQ